MTRPLWDPAYAELVAARNAGIKAAGKPALERAYRNRQCLAALCDCTAETTAVAEHAAWCAYRRSCERPTPTYDPEAQREMAAVIEQLTSRPLTLDEVKDALRTGSEERRAAEQTLKRSPRR